MMKRLLFSLLLIVSLPALACAQAMSATPATAVVAVGFPATASAVQAPTVNPSLAVFDVPSDHATTTNYVLEVYRQSDGVLARTPTDLGKPTPNAQNKLTGPLVRQGLSNNVVYVFRIVQNNAIGSTRSATTSNPFVMGEPPVGVSGLVAQ